MNPEERRELNFQACQLMRSVGISFYQSHEICYDFCRKKGYYGFANLYLYECIDKSELINKADVTIYKQLLEIDAKFGTTQMEQLWSCVRRSLRIDLIKV